MRNFKHSGWACRDMCRYYCTDLLWWVSFIDFSHSLAWSESVSALFWHKTRGHSLVPSYTDSQLGTGLIYDSLLHIAYRPLLQVWVARNLHVAVITVFLELPFVYTGVMVTQHLKPILSQSYWDCMFSITLLCHILHNDLLCTLKGKKHKIYQKLSESLCTSESQLWSWWYSTPYAGQIIKLFHGNSFIYPSHTTAITNTNKILRWTKDTACKYHSYKC